jgi:hypothetical protein
MLTQFRKYYPQGSLISELVEIDRGKYIVRALVQVEGVTIATGLASCDTVEQAEDRARDRALSLLNLNEEVVIHPEVTQTKSQVIEATEPVSSKESDRATSKERKKPTASINEIVSSQDKNEVSESLPSRSNGATSSKSKTSKITNSFISEPQLEIQETTSEIVTPKETKSLISEPPLEIPETTPEIVTSKETKSLISDPPLEIPETTPEVATPQETRSFTSKSRLDLPEATSEIVEPEEKDAIVETTAQLASADRDRISEQEAVSFDDLIAQTDREIKRLGWTKEQGRDYLIQAYGKRSRLMLLDEELREFLYYLKTQS